MGTACLRESYTIIAAITVTVGSVSFAGLYFLRLVSWLPDRLDAENVETHQKSDSAENWDWVFTLDCSVQNKPQNSKESTEPEHNSEIDKQEEVMHWNLTFKEGA